MRVWDAARRALARGHRVLRWDLPGHGGSPAGLVPGDDPTTIADLARLVLDLADCNGWPTFAYAGISLGGAIGTWLALHHPDRVAQLAMVCSSAQFGPAPGWIERAALVRTEGTAAVADAAAGRWFTPAFAATATATALVGDLLAADPAGYAACCAALSRYDLRTELPRITVPTLVIAGRDDPATPPAHARELADGIPGASLLELAGTAHLAPVEAPQLVAAALLQHLGAAPTAAAPASAAAPAHATAASAAAAPAQTDAARREAGMTVRRAVLGDAHVDRGDRRHDRRSPRRSRTSSPGTRGARSGPGRGLDRRTRSCITLTALVAHGHLDELAMHVRAALRNGLTPDEIGEVLLQAGVYCGVPAANAAYAVAQRTLREDGVELGR